LKTYLKHTAIETAAREVADRIASDFTGNNPVNIGAVPRGGIPCLYILSKYTPSFYHMESDLSKCDIIIDDVIDSGLTKDRIIAANPIAKFYAFFTNPVNWLVFPWEETAEKSIEDDIHRICQYHNIHNSELISKFKNQLTNKKYLLQLLEE